MFGSELVGGLAGFGVKQTRQALGGAVDSICRGLGGGFFSKPRLPGSSPAAPPPG